MRDEYRRHIGKSVMVEIDGNTVGGTLARYSPTTLTLTDAALIAGPSGSVPVDGEIILSRADVIWTQVAADA